MPEPAYREVSPMNRKEAQRPLVQIDLETQSIRKTTRIWAPPAKWCGRCGVLLALWAAHPDP